MLHRLFYIRSHQSNGVILKTLAMTLPQSVMVMTSCDVVAALMEDGVSRHHPYFAGLLVQDHLFATWTSILSDRVHR